MAGDMHGMGEQEIDSRRTVVRIRQENGFPKEILTLSYYWNPEVGHVFFLNGRGFEIEEKATFFHFNGPGFNSMVSVMDVKVRPEL
jgi:hypothetical protein